ncbi:MAG: TIGR00725 family protein [Waterburya sp.]
MSNIIVGVMGAGNSATSQDLAIAYQLGQAIAENNWVLLTGGRKVGVMDAASRGAKANDGLVIGILPSNNIAAMSDAVDIPIITDMGNARNNINVLSSNVVIACGMGLGTASEVALALKNHKSVILINQTELTRQFFASLTKKNLFYTQTVENAIAVIKEILTD